MLLEAEVPATSHSCADTALDSWSCEAYSVVFKNGQSVFTVLYTQQVCRHTRD